jgi:hypothetical protein
MTTKGPDLQRSGSCSIQWPVNLPFELSQQARSSGVPAGPAVTDGNGPTDAERWGW